MPSIDQKSPGWYEPGSERLALDGQLQPLLLRGHRIACGVARKSFGLNIVYQERVGANGVTFLMPKIETLDPETGLPINDTAEAFRSKGIDELIQALLFETKRNADSPLTEIEETLAKQRAYMTFWGRRGLLLNEHDEFVDTLRQTNLGRNLLAEHIDIVMPTNTGILAKLSLDAHTRRDPTAIERAQGEIDGVKTASKQAIFRTIGSGFVRLAKREMKRGRIGIDHSEQ